MPRPARVWCSPLLLLAPVLLTASCSTPPTKEIDLATQALAEAEAADADELAPDEVAAARAALNEAQAGITAEDYRLALSRALDARELAGTATQVATERRAAVRAEVERMLADIDVARAKTQAALKAASGRAAAPTLAAARAAVASIDELVQEARSALERGDPVGARDRLQGVVDRLRAVDADLQAAVTTPRPSADRMG